MKTEDMKVGCGYQEFQIVSGGMQIPGMKIEVISQSDGRLEFTLWKDGQMLLVQNLSVFDIFEMLPRAIVALEKIQSEKE